MSHFFLDSHHGIDDHTTYTVTIAQMDLGMATWPQKPWGGPTWFEIGMLNYDMLMMNIGYLF